MKNHCPANERVKRHYFGYLKAARGRDDATIDSVARAIDRFEKSTGIKDFKRFHREQVVAFRTRLADASNIRTGERLSKATTVATLRHLKAFFFWLAEQRGYKSRIRYEDADYFSPSDKDLAISRASREKHVPDLEMVHLVLASMAATTVLERRDRALIAFTMLTAARVSALATFRLQHIDLVRGFVMQDARTVKTKFAKSFPTFFMPVGGDALEMVRMWIEELRNDHHWGPSDPLFPATAVGVGDQGGFVATGIARKGWATTAAIREIFKRAFTKAGLPYFNPHSFRDMVTRYAMSLDLRQDEMKAWSQNLGHKDLLTTYTSYGTIPAHQQGELVRSAARPRQPRVATLTTGDIDKLKAFVASLPITGDTFYDGK